MAVIRKTKKRFYKPGQNARTVQAILSLVLKNPPLQKHVRQQTQEDLDDAVEWAWREHLRASDNLYVPRWPCPKWITDWIASHKGNK